MRLLVSPPALRIWFRGKGWAVRRSCQGAEPPHGCSLPCCLRDPYPGALAERVAEANRRQLVRASNRQSAPFREVGICIMRVHEKDHNHLPAANARAGLDDRRELRQVYRGRTSVKYTCDGHRHRLDDPLELHMLDGGLSVVVHVQRGEHPGQERSLRYARERWAERSLHAAG